MKIKKIILALFIIAIFLPLVACKSKPVTPDPILPDEPIEPTPDVPIEPAPQPEQKACAVTFKYLNSNLEEITETENYFWGSFAGGIPSETPKFYSFTGWKNGDDISMLFEIPEVETLTLEAVYEDISVTLSIKDGIQNWIEPIKIRKFSFDSNYFYEDVKEAYSLIEDKLSNETNPSAVFVGANYEEIESPVKIEESTLQSLLMEGDVTLYFAQGEPSSIRFFYGETSDAIDIEYICNFTDFNKQTILDYFNEHYQLPEGYVLNGWNIEALTEESLQKILASAQKDKYGAVHYDYYAYPEIRLLNSNITVIKSLVDEKGESLLEETASLQIAGDDERFNKPIDFNWFSALSDFASDYNSDDLTFLGYFDLEGKEVSNVLACDGEITIIAKYKYYHEPNVYTDVNHPIIELPEYYEEGICSDIDVIHFSYLISGKKASQITSGARIYYDTEYVQNNMIIAQTYKDNNMYYLSFEINRSILNRDGFEFEKIVFDSIEEEIILKFAPQIDVTGLTNKGIILTQNNYATLTELESFKELLDSEGSSDNPYTNGYLHMGDFLTNNYSSYGSNYGWSVSNQYDVYTNRVLIANIYQIEDIIVTDYENSFFGGKYSLIGNYNLNGHSLTLKGTTVNATMFDMIAGEISNGTIYFDAKKPLANTNIESAALINTVLPNSKLKDLTINANNLGFSLTEKENTNVNYVISYIDSDVLFEKMNLVLSYNFMMDEDGLETRKDRYLITNNYAPFKYILGSTAHGETETEDAIKGLSITVSQYKVCEFLQNQKSFFEVERGDYYFNEDEDKYVEMRQLSFIDKVYLVEYHRAGYSDYDNTTNDYQTNLQFFTANANKDFKYGIAVPNFYIVGKYVASMDGSFCPEGYGYSEPDENGYTTLEPLGEVISNDVIVSFLDSSSDYCILREHYNYCSYLLLMVQINDNEEIQKCPNNPYDMSVEDMRDFIFNY